MQGKFASSQFDFGYTEQFCIPGVTSVYFLPVFPAPLVKEVVFFPLYILGKKILYH